VRERSELDREAYERGTSVYLVDRVIPMLPQRLSNGICSLNPEEDRLTITCLMDCDDNGAVIKHDIFKSVISSKKRMTYENVRKVLVEQDADAIADYAGFVDKLELMQDLALKLRGRRLERGAIDFDFDEIKITVDETGKPIDIQRVERSIAEQLIEEFMLAANEAVAEHFYWLEAPFIYRVHEDPDPDKLLSFAEFLSSLGLRAKGLTSDPHPRVFQEILKKIKDTPEERIISTLLLRSLKQARYYPEPLGHFGLSTKYYTHFTSPIRRYPDLQIHRIISEILDKGKLTDGRVEFLQGIMPEVAAHSSERERIAVDAERETDDLKKAEYMLDKIGEEYEGIISSVTSFGMFVELQNLIEGLVHVSYLTDDYYRYNDNLHALVGERTAKVYRIGDPVNVRVVKVNLDDYTIDFELVVLNGGYRRNDMTKNSKKNGQKNGQKKGRKIRRERKGRNR
jgi:ribonuclease R